MTSHDHRLPRSTYRLQVSRDFDLDAAAAAAGYVQELGADWLYLSPLLTAAAAPRTGTT